MQNNISRRESLAAIALVGVGTTGMLAAAAVATEGETVDRAEWDRAFLAYQSAKAASDHFERTYMKPAEDAFAAALPDGGEGGLIGKSQAYRDQWNVAYQRHIGSVMVRGTLIEDTSEQLANAKSDRSLDLHRLPAPDRPALLWKALELWADDPSASFVPWIVEQFVDDARRLLGEA